VKADMLQVGDFKGASEPLTRSEMSPEFRKQFESVIDDLYNQMVDTIAAERKLDRGRVKDLLDQGLFTATAAKEAGLIDRVAYEDEFRAWLKDQAKADEIKLADDYGKQKIDVDFSGFGGMMKLMEMISGGGEAKKKNSGKKIAIVYAVGVIMPGESASGLFEATLGGETLVKALRKAEEDDDVAAIVLRVNSPGGSALASDLVWREVTRIKKPIVASMGDMAASGGYYISMGADKILAEPRTLTGSIGVVGGKMALAGLFSKLGIKTEVISRGKNSGWESMEQPFSASEREAWLGIMKDIYEQFTTKAAQGRKMEVTELETLAQGRIYTGRQAVANKLADQLGTLDDAVAEAKKLAGIGESEAVERLILPEPKSFFEDLLMGPSLEASASRVVKRELQTTTPGLLDILDDAARLPRLFREPAVTIMPFRVRIR
jgi:protease-4